MDESLRMVGIELKRTYEEIVSLAEWSIHQDAVLPMAMYYTIMDETFDSFHFSNVLSDLQQTAPLFSPLKGDAGPLVAMFLTKNERYEQQLQIIYRRVAALRAQGFRHSYYTYIAALFMDETQSYDEQARRAFALYRAMKKRHFFLTSDDDYALAVVLSRAERDPDQHAQAMRMYYDALRKAGFRYGNTLQTLSHLLADEAPTFTMKVVEQVVYTERALRPMYAVDASDYGLLGLLSRHMKNTTKIKQFERCMAHYDDHDVLSTSRHTFWFTSSVFLHRQFYDKKQNQTYNRREHLERIALFMVSNVFSAKLFTPS